MHFLYENNRKKHKGGGGEAMANFFLKGSLCRGHLTGYLGRASSETIVPAEGTGGSPGTGGVCSL